MRLRNHPQEDAQYHAQHRAIALHEVTHPIWHRQLPLAQRQAREDVVGEVCRRLCHAPHVARGADATAFAGEGQQKVVPADVAPGA